MGSNPATYLTSRQHLRGLLQEDAAFGVVSVAVTKPVQDRFVTMNQ